ncbi:MAG: YfhO family protein [Lachnospiraceae bacterium]|nr:YfhO family protein [Lachnospiraceae bacterium]
MTTNRNTRSSKIFLCSFFIPFLMMQIFWAVCKMYPFGDNSILTGDMNVEFVNFYAYFINTLKTNNDWSYMLTKTLGGDFPGLAAFQLHDPLLFLLLAFPGEKIVLGIELIFSLQISIASLSMSVLLNKRYKTSWMSLLFSIGYAFSSFFFGYLVLTIYFGALAILPLVLYFFLKLVDDGKSAVPFIITAALYIYINYHMGFMLVIFLVILYISRIIRDTSSIKRLPVLALSGVCVLLINGFFLVRTGLSLLGEKTTEGADYGFYRRFPMNQLLAGMFSGCARNDLRPLIYCSVAAFFFAVVYFLSKSYDLREKLANAFVLASVAVSMYINLFDAVWHGFNNPEGFYWRYAYFISITVVVTGYKGYISLICDDSEGDRETKEKVKIVIISAALIFLYMIWLLIMKNPYLDMPRFVLNAVLTAVITVFAIMIIRGKYRPVWFLLLFAVSVSEMLYSSKTAYISLNSENGGFPSMTAFFEDYRNINDVVSFIKSEDTGFYRMEKDFDRGINDPSMFDYIGLSHDSSCEKDEILDWLVNFGFCKTVYFTYYNGGSTAFVDDLFGIKYYISKFDTIEKPYEMLPYNGKYHAYKNPDALPLAFIAPESISEIDLNEGDTFEKQNSIASCWSTDPVYIKAEPEITLEGAQLTQEGRYVRTQEEGYIVYTIQVSRNMPLYFYFYAPSRQEGEVFVNGESRDVYFTVNHWNTLCAGTYNEGDTVEIKMQILGNELEISRACFYYEDPEAIKKWGEAASKLNGYAGDVVKITSSNLTFETDCPEEETVIVSIPYEQSWAVYCDGEKINTSPALGQLMSFRVSDGHHEIRMKYTPAGTYPGLILSVLGILMLIIIMTKDETLGSLKLLKRSKIRNLQK